MTQDLTLNRIALVSVHGCPMMVPGLRSAGGMNVYIRHLAEAIAAKGVCVDVFTRSHEKGGPHIVQISPRARVIHLDAGPEYATKEEVYQYLPDFAHKLDEFCVNEGMGYDLVHSHYWFSGWVGQRIAPQWKVPHIVMFHTLAHVKERVFNVSEPMERHQNELAIACTADGLVASTEEERQTLINICGALPDRVHVTPGGADIELFQPRDKAASRKKLGLDSAEHILLYVGRVEPFKGPDILLKAVALLRHTNRRLRVVIVGGGGDQDSEVVRLKQVAADIGVTDLLYWHDAVPQDQLPDYYAAADICIVPSYHESFGLVALEAMACGTPVIASRVGGLASLVLHDRTGFLIEGHEPKDFAIRIEQLLGDREMRWRFGVSARRWATRFPWERTVREVMTVYKEAMSANAVQAPVFPCPEQ